MEKWAKDRSDNLKNSTYEVSTIVRYIFFHTVCKSKKFNKTLWKEAYLYITARSVN